MVNFIVLIILHLLGDFYLQTAKVAKCKNAKITIECKDCMKCKKNSKFNPVYLLIHILIYIIPFFLLFFTINGIGSAIIAILIIAISHGVIDCFSCIINKKIKQTSVLIIDQILHTLVLFLVYNINSFNSIFDKYIFVIKTIFTVLLVIAPCSIFINKLFEDLYQEKVFNGFYDIGSIIGIFERLLVLIFALFGDFAAIAIIITVKTWARSNDLKDKEFRNKYLLGTLASLVLALCCYILFKII